MMSSVYAAKIFKFLQGKWRIERNISQQNITVRGHASFTLQTQDQLFYKEEGTLHLPQKINFSREYLYQYTENELSVYFVESDKLKLFHRLEFLLPTFVKDKNVIAKALASHQCNADFYAGEYLFFPDDQFSLIYQVSGPRKHYRIATMFHRLLD